MAIKLIGVDNRPLDKQTAITDGMRFTIDVPHLNITEEEPFDFQVPLKQQKQAEFSFSLNYISFLFKPQQISEQEMNKSRFIDKGANIMRNRRESSSSHNIPSLANSHNIPSLANKFYFYLFSHYDNFPDQKSQSGYYLTYDRSWRIPMNAGISKPVIDRSTYPGISLPIGEEMSVNGLQRNDWQYTYVEFPCLDNSNRRYLWKIDDVIRLYHTAEEICHLQIHGNLWQRSIQINVT